MTPTEKTIWFVTVVSHGYAEIRAPHRARRSASPERLLLPLRRPRSTDAAPRAGHAAEPCSDSWRGRSRQVRISGQLHEQLSLLVSARSAHLGAICEDLRPQLGLEAVGLRLLQRKQRLREAVAAAGRTVVFDGVGWVSPKLRTFFESVTERAPVWICARSEHPWDIGHFWPLLVRFARVEVRPLHPSETQALVEAAVAAGGAPAATLGIVEWLQRRSGGKPLVLRELFGELATGKYDLTNPQALGRLDLDRRSTRSLSRQGEPDMNENHTRHLLATFRHIDGLLSEVEHLLATAGPTSPFAEYTQDSTPVQRKVVHHYIQRVRQAMGHAMTDLGLPGPRPCAEHCGRRAGS